MSYSPQPNSAAAATAAVAPATVASDTAQLRSRAQALARRAPRPELLGVMALAAVLNLWALSRNGWANDYYSAAVRSMGSSWHDFLYASLASTHSACSSRRR